MVRSETQKKIFYQNQTQAFFDMMMTKCHNVTAENDKWPLTEYKLQDINLGRDAISHQADSEESLLTSLSGTVSRT